MKEVKIEYSDVLPTFCCGLTPFSNLLQLIPARIFVPNSCGLTTFSNLLQLQAYPKMEQYSCGLTTFSNLLQP